MSVGGFGTLIEGDTADTSPCHDISAELKDTERDEQMKSVIGGFSEEEIKAGG